MASRKMKEELSHCWEEEAAVDMMEEEVDMWDIYEEVYMYEED